VDLLRHLTLRELYELPDERLAARREDGCVLRDNVILWRALLSNTKDVLLIRN
jgi:hypothetical protein